MPVIATLAALTLGTSQPGRTERLVFPLHPQHNHASCVVECPSGDLLVTWYRGSGERTADDVAIMGARLRKGSKTWSEAFVMADTPGFPDCNPCMIVDAASRLWLFWPVILDNQWESALLRYAVSTDFQRKSGPPRWTDQGVVLLKPGEEFTRRVEAHLAHAWHKYAANLSSEERSKLETYIKDRVAAAGTKLRMRLGWMPRPHPVIFGNRFFLPLYSDLFDFSLIAYSDDSGRTWRVSEPIVGAGNVQPCLAQRRDDTLVAFFRDNGPPPQRVMVSTSSNNGLSWTAPEDTVLPDPGAGVDVVVLKSGRWVLVNNDTENGRHSLALTISEDEGRTWTRKAHLEHDTPGPGAGSYSYPSIIQARDGTIHVTYTYTPNSETRARLGPGKSIKHVSFTEEWLLNHAKPLD